MHETYTGQRKAVGHARSLPNRCSRRRGRTHPSKQHAPRLIVICVGRPIESVAFVSMAERAAGEQTAPFFIASRALVPLI